MEALVVTRTRLERKVADRSRFYENVQEILKGCEDEGRDPTDTEQEHLDRYRTQIAQADAEIETLAEELERHQRARDVSKLIRVTGGGELIPAVPQLAGGGEELYRTFHEYARDELIRRYPLIANAAAAGAGPAHAESMAQRAVERLETLKRVVNTTSSNVAGLTAPAHLSQILDIINASRPVVQSGRPVNLASGSLTYPQIAQRPQVLKQSGEKTEGGTNNMQVTLQTIAADTYIGGGDLSWQTINWSSPDALMLWFDLAGEAYARQTETAACSELGTAGGGTSSPALGTAGTEDFAGWQAAVMAGISSIYTTTGGRCQTDTLWLAANRFFQLAQRGTSAVLQVSSVGGLDVNTLTGTWMGLRVIGSYGFANNVAVVGDASALLVGENQGAPVELRAVEPNIGGMQVGVIGAFKAKVYDSNRFIHIG